MTPSTLASLLALIAAAPPALAPAPRTATFVIDLREAIAAGRFDPAHDQVGVRGGVAPLSWETTTLAADPDGDGRHEVTVTFPRVPYGGQAVPYKFKVERPGAPRDGWEDGRNHRLVLREPGQTVARAFGAPPGPVPLERAGEFRAHPAFPSRFVAARNVEVHLPPGYDASPRARYPVLYLHDGQNVFDAAAAGMEWQADEAAEQLIRAGEVEPFIVVAIASSPARRDDYTPTAIEQRLEDGGVTSSGGKAPLYARFLLEELKPFIDRTYRTRPGPASAAVGGASHGGLVSLFLVLEHPEVFGQAVVMSPSAMWDDGVMLKRIAALPRQLPVRLWVDSGALERKVLVDAARDLRQALLARGWREGVDLAFEEQAGGQHDEISWASRLPGALRFLWPARRAPAPTP